MRALFKNLPRAGSVLASASLAACSLVDLSSEIEQAQCASHDDCEVLNDREARDFDPCVTWQCAETSLCERYRLDLDYDGFTQHTVMHDGEELVCEADASRRDCDDSNDMSSPAEPEVCDALDNDCDARTDEGELEPDTAITNVFADENAGGTGEVSYAIDPDSGTIAAGYGIIRGASTVPGLSTIASSLRSGSAINPLELPDDAPGNLLADSVGVAALGGERFAVAFMNTSGGRHLVAGLALPRGDAFQLQADAEVLRRGLRCAAGEACDGNQDTRAGDPIVAAPLTITPALAASGDDVLVVYARSAEGEGACAEPGGAAESAPVLASALRYDASADTLSELPAAAVEVGATRDRNIPAVLAVPELGGASDLGFIAAFANTGGAIELVHVAFEEGALVRGATLLELADDERSFGDVALVLGPGEDRAYTVGLAAQRGCGAQARAVFYTLALSIEGGELRLRRAAGPVGVGGSPNETRPSVAFSEARDSWLVAYRDGGGLRARALTREATLLGAESYTLLSEVDSGDDALRLAATAYAVPLSGAAWFGAIAATERAEDYVLQTITLSSCE